MTIDLINRKEQENQEKNQGQKKYIMDYEEKILKHKRILLNAPTSSGKTEFALKFLSSLGKVLFISSRISIDKQTRKLIKKLRYKKNITIITQWNTIEANIDVSNFQFIVIDECHLLTSDTFAIGAFYVSELIKKTPEDVTLILQSACAWRVRDYIRNILKVNMTYINLEGKVHGVKPCRVSIIRSKQSHKLLDEANLNNKILYYGETTNGVFDLDDLFTEKGKRCISITSQPEKRNNPEKEKRGKEVLDILIETQKFPEDIDIIFCTSKLREGINIKDHNVKTLITELKDAVSLIQCAGRIRHGVENMMVISDKGNRVPFYSSDKMKNVNAWIEPLNCCISGASESMNNKEKNYLIDGLKGIASKHFGDLIIYADKKFHVNIGLIYEVKERLKENKKYKAYPEEYVKSIVPCQDLTESFDTILTPYIDRRITPMERKELIRTLNIKGWDCKQLKPTLEKNGYEYSSDSPKNRNYYIITKKKCVLPFHLAPLINPLFEHKRTKCL